ncbi:Quinone oxidoreductase PIG3 [Talaromyces pinophilus]|nr:Quinone oxidoreductase PIG3 [Talaromyces pinophilus]
MDAIVISEFGSPEVLKKKNVPKPTPVHGEVLVRVKAFGLNHAEMHMRKGEWDEWNPITGLECVGIVEACPSGDIPIGTKVAGVMGGMGRNRPGSYGEFVNIPLPNVVPVNTTLSWEDFAAIPEVYSTAYSCLFTILDLQASESLLIRGATSTLGQAALHLAIDLGAKVTATSRRESRFGMLKEMGASDVKIEKTGIQSEFDENIRFDKILNLIGNSVLVETISLVRTHGRILQAGWLGGLAPVQNFNPMIEMQSGAHFSLFHSKVLGTPGFPMSGVPLQQIVDKIQSGRWNAKPTHVFNYEDIQEAHELLDSHNAGGKIVVKH